MDRLILQEQNGVHKLHMPSFASGPQMTFSNTGLAQNSQQVLFSLDVQELLHNLAKSSICIKIRIFKYSPRSSP